MSAVTSVSYRLRQLTAVARALGSCSLALIRSKTFRTSASSALSSLPWSIWELSRTIGRVSVDECLSLGA